MQDLVGPVPLLVRNCTISGTKYHDIDADGVIDAGEPTIAGWKLYIDSNNNNQLDAGEPTTLTDANGNYTFTNLTDATYTIREAPDAEQAAGLKGYFCSFPSKTDSLCEHAVTISAADRTITGKDFANYKKAVVKVEKQTLPDGAAGSFAFASTIPGKASFDLSDNGVNTTTVDPGVYTATETVPAGWSLTDITCSGDTITPNSSDAGSTATFNAQSGETITCVFTNTKHASLTVKKVTDPASDPQDFDFDLTGSGVTPDLDLDTDAGDNTLASEQTFSLTAAQFGAYTVTESAAAGLVADRPGVHGRRGRLVDRRGGAQGDAGHRRGRERGLHVHQHQARVAAGDQGHRPGVRPAGLRVRPHGRGHAGRGDARHGRRQRGHCRPRRATRSARRSWAPTR